MGETEVQTGLAVVDQRRSNALVGSLSEKLQAFDQLAAAIAGLQLNGWDMIPKAKAACWLADAASVHPATFIQNHYYMILPGPGGSKKIVVEPKVDFVLGTLQSRIPGFRFEVLEETDEACEVRMSDASGNTHTVRYTIEDAKRQGLMGRGGNMWTSGNTREGCYKQAVKRCGRRIGAAALLDLPVGFDGVEIEAAGNGGASDAKSDAEVMNDEIDEAIDKIYGEAEETAKAAAGTKPAPAAKSKLGLVEAPGGDARTELSEALRRFYGPISKKVALEKASLIYNQMMLEQTGTDPRQAFRRADEIGPHEARQIIEYLGKRGAAAVTTPPADAPPPPEEEPPVAEGEFEAGPPPDEESEVVEASVSDAFTYLMVTVERARKLFPRKFVQEAPPGSARLWYTDQHTYAQAGHAQSVKLKVADEVTLGAEQLDQLNRILTAECDAKERGGR